MKLNDYSDYAVIIPTLNEENNVGLMVDFIINNYSGIEIIISDDGSKDKTQNIVKNKISSYNKEKIVLIDRSQKNNKGLTASVLDAIKTVRKKYFIVMDCDFQHPPEKISNMLILLDRFDLVIGCRKNLDKVTFFRNLISNTAELLCTIRLIPKPYKTKDPLSGFFASKTSLFKKTIQDNKKLKRYEGGGYKVLFDFLKINEKNIVIKDLFFNFDNRKRDKSKLNLKHIFLFLRSLFK